MGFLRYAPLRLSHHGRLSRRSTQVYTRTARGHIEEVRSGLVILETNFNPGDLTHAQVGDGGGHASDARTPIHISCRGRSKRRDRLLPACLSRVLVLGQRMMVIKFVISEEAGFPAAHKKPITDSFHRRLVSRKHSALWKAY